jgi:hypothetical protein
MDTPSPYKRAKICSGKNLKTIVETLPLYNDRSFSIIITGDETWVNFYKPKKGYVTKYG